MTLTLRSSGELHQRCRLAWKLEKWDPTWLHKSWPETQPSPTTQNSCCKYMCKEHHSPSRPLAALWSRRCLEWTSSQQRHPQCWQQCTGSEIKQKFSYCTSYTYTPCAQAACSISSSSTHVTTDNCMRMLLLLTLHPCLTGSGVNGGRFCIRHMYSGMCRKTAACAKSHPVLAQTSPPPLPQLEWSDTTTTITKHDNHCRHTTTRFSNGTEGSDITTASVFLWCTIGLWCSLVLKQQ